MSQKTLTYTQIGTLLHAILDIVPSESVREQIVAGDNAIQNNGGKEFDRLLHLARQMEEGILQNDWELTELGDPDGFLE